MYKGWTIKESHSPGLERDWVATRDGVDMYASNRELLERMIDRRTEREQAMGRTFDRHMRDDR